MAFNIPINSIAPIPTPSDWVRPSDWIAITDNADSVQFLVADIGAKAFTIRTTFTRTTGNIYIDWGDGTVDTVSTTTSTDTSHVYSTGGTPCSRGYNTWKIRIYGDATCVITNAQHVTNRNVTGGVFYNIGLLEAYFGNNTCNTTAVSSNYFNSFNTTNSSGCFQHLEYVKLPATVTWDAQMVGMFMNCTNLYVVVMPTSAPSLTTISQMVSGCVNLRDIVLPSNATTISTLLSTFSGCSNLRTISFPTSLNSCTSLATAFNNCTSLKNITLPSINLVTSLSSTFSGCTSLQWVKFTSLPAPASPTAIVATTLFLNCYNLQNVYFPASCSANAQFGMTQTFQACTSLTNVLFPTNFNASTLTSCFSSCLSLTNVVFQSSMSSLTNMSSTFSGCTFLNSVTLPTSVSGTGIDMGSAFSSCQALTSITIPSAWTITNLSSTFLNCFNLVSITLSISAGGSTITSMSSMCSGCSKLKTIVLPTNLTAVTNIGSIFQNCYTLNSVVFPSTMNAVTTASTAFSNCWNLTSVTMPTSMSTCTTFNSTFVQCYSLTSLTMPATVSASVSTYVSLVSQCANLATLTLPTTQTSASLTDISSMFYACGSLLTINNLDKVGSLTATPLVNGTIASAAGSYANRLTSLSFSCPFSVLALNGQNTAANTNRLTSLRLLNASAGQYTGTSPQINVSYCDLGITALNQLFTDLPTVTAKTINITGCTGAAGCTRTIATTKGWTVTG